MTCQFPFYDYYPGSELTPAGIMANEPTIRLATEEGK